MGYEVCKKCQVKRNILIAPDCPICKWEDVKQKIVARGQAYEPRKKEVNPQCKYCGKPIKVGKVCKKCISKNAIKRWREQVKKWKKPSK